MTMWFALGREVSIESRVVTSFPAMFGEIVGLRDFFNFIIIFVIGGMQSKFYQFDMLKTFFRYSASNDPRISYRENVSYYDSTAKDRK